MSVMAFERDRLPGRCGRCGSGQHGEMCTSCGGRVYGRGDHVFVRGKGTRVGAVLVRWRQRKVGRWPRQSWAWGMAGPAAKLRRNHR